MEATPLTKNERHKAYIACLKELYRCKENNELFFMCTSLRDNIAPGATDVIDRIKTRGFDEFFKHKPPYADYAWFGGLDYEPRIKILESLIAETAEWSHFKNLNK